MKKKTILLGLNELNFDYIKFYVDQGLLPNFKKIFEIQPCRIGFILVIGTPSLD